jgi:hypothetical protein
MYHVYPLHVYVRAITILLMYNLIIILWHADPLLGNDSLNTSPRQRIRVQQSDNVRCYATCSKYNDRGRGVYYVVRIYPLLGNGCFLLVGLESI